MKLSSIVAAAAALAAIYTGENAAHACGGALWEDRIVLPKPSPAKLIANAEKSLEGGNFAATVSSAADAFGDLATAKPSKDAIKNRALRVVALAIVRGKGAQRLPRQKEATPAARMEWAATTLKALSDEAKLNPTLEGDLGEALAAAGHDTEALAHLNSLSDRDLLGSPHAYAVLSKLQFAAGLTSKSARSLGRCQAIAANPSVCGLPEKPSTNGSPAGATPEAGGAHASGKANGQVPTSGGDAKGDRRS